MQIVFTFKLWKSALSHTKDVSVLPLTFDLIVTRQVHVASVYVGGGTKFNECYYYTAIVTF